MIHLRPLPSQHPRANVRVSEQQRRAIHEQLKRELAEQTEEIEQPKRDPIWWIRD